MDEFIQAGYRRLDEVRAWEPQHLILRKEHGREVSATKEDKISEIISILSQDPDMKLEDIDKQLHNYGMSLGTIDKVHILMSQRNTTEIKIESLLSKKKEYS